ncbi:MAG: putative transport system permease protein [Acidimicrobiaceae bacterium]|nr:putative transport system permease protein [Acidimicrobiaceae bacterium]
MSGRRAVLRWGWRLFRAEWRQQILVMALLSVAVATATFAACFTYNMAADSSGVFGSADQRITFSGSDPAATAVDIGAARKYFGTVDVIATRSVPVPGLTKNLEFRAQDPHGPYSQPMLGLRTGRYPMAADEVAVTASVAQTLKLAVGATLSLDGRSRRVVGLVENPGDLSDEFALLSPAGTDIPDRVSLLVKGGNVDDFRTTMTVAGNVERESRADQKALAAVFTFGLAAVGMLLVALIAAAGFVVMAQRRLRELGMLAAVGATERHVRLVTLVNGVLIGVIAAAVGTSTGLLAWVAALGRVEAAAGHRINGLSVPWWLLATSVVLAIATATAAAWWPARVVARIPIMSALSTRPPRPKPAHRSAIVAVLLIVAGVGSFALAHQTNPYLIIAGALATPIGVLFVAPLAIRAAARSAARLPIAARLALRDLGRYQARSGAALAAIILALGVPVSVIIIASAAEAQTPRGNLADSQLFVRFQVDQRAGPLNLPDRSAAEVAALDARVGELAATLDHATVVPLDLAVDPNQSLRPDPFAATGRLALGVVHQLPGQNHASILPLYVASPQLLAAVGADPAALDTHEFQTATTGGDFSLFSNKEDRTRTPLGDLTTISTSGYSSLPDTFVSPSAALRRGWQPVRGGWLVSSASALTPAQRSAALDLAVAAGLTVETADHQASLSALRTGATAAGMLLALGVLAMTVGLIRSEAAGDLRTLTATGASSTVRRHLTAATAGALAALGTLLGIAGAYLVMLGAFSNRLGDLANVPVAHLAVILVGVPLVATLAGWLLAGREPPPLARPAFE